MLANDGDEDMTTSEVLFKLKDYDLVGPMDFHDDRLFDKGRDGWGRPWLSIKINFYSSNLNG